MKGFVHQIYCTHCTYGTSAVEQRQGDMADRVLGYGARASSLETADLRKHYREIERFLYYTLSVDSPSDEKKRLTAETAPRRLVYCPAIGGVKMLGQMSYRQTDTAGRPGSYFGHVLIADRAESWSVLDCLQTWGAPWCDQDSPALPFKLPTLPAVKAVHASGRPRIDDAVLLSFLKTPAGGAFDDPHDLIPPRWRAAPQHERLELLADSLRAFLQLAVDRRESLLLVVEPSVATLIFYGIARLLPPGSLRDELSFSTFEHNTDRLPVTLAATTFHTPETSDLKPDAYRGRGYVNNTYLKKTSTAPRNPSPYAALMVDTLAAEGIAAVDAMHVDFSVAAPKKSEDLELLAQARNKVTALLAASSPAVTWKDGVEAGFLSSSIRRALAFADANSPVLAGVVGSANHLAVLELIATDTDVGTREAVRHLSLTLPSRMLSAFVDSQRIADDAKLAPLLAHIRKHKDFPPNCESLWSRPAPHGRQRPAAGVEGGLLPKILEQVSAPEIVKLYEHVPLNGRIAYLTSLLVVCRNDSSKAPAVSELIDAIDEDAFAHLLETHAEDLRRNFSRKDPQFGERLNRAMFGLVHNPRQFLHRLDLLKKWLEYFPDIAKTEYRLENWRKVYRTFEKARDSAPKANASLLEKLTGGNAGIDDDKLGWALAEGMKEAMPSAYCDDPDGSLKIGFLKELGTIMLGSSTFLGPEVWRRIDYFYESGQWSSPISKRGGAGFQKPGGLTSPRNLMIGGAILVPVFVTAVMAFRPKDQPPQTPADPQPPLIAQLSASSSASSTNPAPAPTAGVARNTPSTAASAATSPKPAPPKLIPPSTEWQNSFATLKAWHDNSQNVEKDKYRARLKLVADLKAALNKVPGNGGKKLEPEAAKQIEAEIAARRDDLKTAQGDYADAKLEDEIQSMHDSATTLFAESKAWTDTSNSTAAFKSQLINITAALEIRKGDVTTLLSDIPSTAATIETKLAELKAATLSPDLITRFQFRPLPDSIESKWFRLGTFESSKGCELKLLMSETLKKEELFSPAPTPAVGRLIIWSKGKAIAEFNLDNDLLQFMWLPDAKQDIAIPGVEAVRECVLELCKPDKQRCFIALYKQENLDAANFNRYVPAEIVTTENGKTQVASLLPMVSIQAPITVPRRIARESPNSLRLVEAIAKAEDDLRVTFRRPPGNDRSNLKLVTPPSSEIRSSDQEWIGKLDSPGVSAKLSDPLEDDTSKHKWNLVVDVLHNETDKKRLADYRADVTPLSNLTHYLAALPKPSDTNETVWSLIKNSYKTKDNYKTQWKTKLESLAKLVSAPKNQIDPGLPSFMTPNKDDEAIETWAKGIEERIIKPAEAKRIALSQSQTDKLEAIKKRQLVLAGEINRLRTISLVLYRKVGDIEIPDIVVGTVPPMHLTDTYVWANR